MRTAAKASLPRHGTDLVGLRGHCDAQLDLEAKRGVWGCLEGEFLEQGCEEEEELGAGQHLTQAGTLPCGDSRIIESYNSLGWKGHSKVIYSTRRCWLMKRPLPSIRTMFQLGYPLPRMSFAAQTGQPNNGVCVKALAAPLH